MRRSVQYSREMYCGWPRSNSAFRSIVCWAVAIIAVLALIAIRRGSTKLALLSTVLYLFSAIAMLAVMTLDANQTRIGSGYCKNQLSEAFGPGFSVDCASAAFAGLAVADAIAVVLLWMTYACSKRQYKYMRGHPPIVFDVKNGAATAGPFREPARTEESVSAV